MTNKKIKLAYMNPEQVANEIGDFIVDQVTSIGYTGGVIGLSGGVDSTTVAALAKRAFDKYNKTLKNGRKNGRLKLVGYMLPTKLNDEKDTTDGEKVARRLGIRYEIKTIDKVVDAYNFTNPEIYNAAKNYHLGNLMAEIRATVLHVKAADEKKLVIGTGNRDEDFGVAYYTLFGDGAVHLSPIGNLSKRMVKEMARYLGFADMADRTPTAGLEPGQTDFKDLGYYYETVELVSEGKMQNFTLDELIENQQVKAHTKKDIEDYEKLFGKKKFQNAEEIILDILRRNKIAEVKAGILHPPVPKITLEYR